MSGLFLFTSTCFDIVPVTVSLHLGISLSLFFFLGDDHTFSFLPFLSLSFTSSSCNSSSILAITTVLSTYRKLLYK